MTRKDTQGVEYGVVSLEIPAQYSFLRVVRQAVSAVCVHAGISEFRAAELEMAVDEVCARIIEHRAISREAPRPIRLRFIHKGDRVDVEFVDVSAELAIAREAAQAPETLRDETGMPGHLGAYVVRRFVDTLDVDTTDGGGSRTLRLTKIL